MLSNTSLSAAAIVEYTYKHVLWDFRLVSYLQFSFASSLLIPLYRKLIFSDPTAFEEPLLDTTITIIVGDENQIVSLSQLGSAVLTVENGQKDALSECISIAKRRREELIRTLPR
jgi:exosome complex RNA-binding protein Rrp42 (RNase PH superfamily)